MHIRYSYAPPMAFGTNSRQAQQCISGMYRDVGMCHQRRTKELPRKTKSLYAGRNAHGVMIVILVDLNGVKGTIWE